MVWTSQNYRGCQLLPLTKPLWTGPCCWLVLFLGRYQEQPLQQPGLWGALAIITHELRSLCYNLWDTLPNGVWNFFSDLQKTSLDWSFQLLWEGNHLQEGSLNSIAIKKKVLNSLCQQSPALSVSVGRDVGWTQVECPGESAGPFTPQNSQWINLKETALSPDDWGFE